MSGFYGEPPVAQLLTNQALGTSTSYTISSSVINRPFKTLVLTFDGLSHDNGSNQTFRVELSADNGGAWSAAQVVTASVAAAAQMSGSIEIDNCDVSASSVRMLRAFLGTDGGGTNMANFVLPVTMVGPINAIRISPSGGNFDQSCTVSLKGFA